METKKTPKNPSFFCEKCDFKTNNKKDYSRHILTPKHKWKHNQDFGKKNPIFLVKIVKKPILLVQGSISILGNVKKLM